MVDRAAREPGLAALAAEVAALLPPGVAMGWADPQRLHAMLPGEGSPAMVPRRLAEFSAGRHAARQALAGLGQGPVALPAGPDRVPLWPVGIAGSITHDAQACLAVASRHHVGLGIDVEPDEALDPRLVDTILRAPERERLRLEPEPGHLARLIFSAKEAAFKAQFPRSRRIFGFEVMEIDFAAGEAGAGRLQARFIEPIAPFAAGFVLHGRYLRMRGQIVSFFAL